MAFQTILPTYLIEFILSVKTHFIIGTVLQILQVVRSLESRIYVMFLYQKYNSLVLFIIPQCLFIYFTYKGIIKLLILYHVYIIYATLLLLFISNRKGLNYIYIYVYVNIFWYTYIFYTTTFAIFFYKVVFAKILFMSISHLIFIIKLYSYLNLNIYYVLIIHLILLNFFKYHIMSQILNFCNYLI